MRQRIDGVCHVYSRSDGSCYIIPRSEHDRIRAEWMAGKAFYEGMGFYGSALTIKLADVVAISDSSPEVMAAQRADTASEQFEDSLP